MARFRDLKGGVVKAVDVGVAMFTITTRGLLFDSNYRMEGYCLYHVEGDPHTLLDGKILDCYCDETVERDDWGDITDCYSVVVIKTERNTVEFHFEGRVDIY